MVLTKREVIHSIFLFFIFSIGCSLIFISLSSLLPKSFGNLSLTLYGQAAAYVLLFYTQPKMSRYVFNSLRFDVLRQFKTYALILISWLACALLSLLFLEYLGIDDLGAQQERRDQEASSPAGGTWLDRLDYILVAAFVCMFLPVFEEAFFRGFLFRYMQQRKGLWWALIGSSALFGFLHSGLFFSTAVLGALSAMMLYWTGSLIPSILFHIVWNSFSFFLGG